MRHEESRRRETEVEVALHSAACSATSWLDTATSEHGIRVHAPIRATYQVSHTKLCGGPCRLDVFVREFESRTLVVLLIAERVLGLLLSSDLPVASTPTV